MFKITDVRSKRVPVEKVVQLSSFLGWDDPVLGEDLWYTGKDTDIHTKDIIDSNPSWELTAEQLLELINCGEYSFNATEMFDLDLPEEKKTLITNVSSKEGDGNVMIVDRGWTDETLSDKQLYYVADGEYDSVKEYKIIYDNNPVFLVNKEDIDYIKYNYDFDYIEGLAAPKALITDVSMKCTPETKVALVDTGWEQPELDPASDMVNHPSHYAHTDLPIEVIDIIEPTAKNYPSEVGYHIGNVIKYLLRAPYKNNLKEDVSKAEFYLKRAKDILEDK